MKLARLTAIFAISVAAFGAGDTIVLDTMSQELQRNFDALKKADTPPYFMAYEITDLNTRVVGATLGVLDATQNSHNRYLDVTVRVGDPTMDNYRRARGEQVQFTSAAPVTIEDIPGALQAAHVARNRSRLPRRRRSARFASRQASRSKPPIAISPPISPKKKATSTPKR